jgi:acyl-CoA synthetase (NDP forming)
MERQTDRDFTRIDAILDTARGEERTFLYEYEVYGVLESLGLAVPRFIHLRTLEDLDPDTLQEIPSERVVVKLVSPDIIHKTEVGGVQFAPNTTEDVVRAYRKIRDGLAKNAPTAKFRGVMVLQMVDYDASFGHEVICSLRQDPAFGPVVTFGAGGVFSEFFGRSFAVGQSVALRSALRLEGGEIGRMIHQPSISQPLFGEIRGLKPMTTEERVFEFLDGLAALAARYTEFGTESDHVIRELEINPVAVNTDGRLVAVDGLAHIDDNKHFPVPRPVERISSLLGPKSAAILGVSASGSNPGRIILGNMLELGGVPAERIYVIHPKAKSIDGVKCVPTIDDLPEKVDMAVVAIPAEAAARAVMDIIIRRKAESIVLIPGGFAETKGGRGLEDEVRAVIRRAHFDQDEGVIVNGGNCLGIYSKPGGYNTFFIPKYKLPFREAHGENVASISQSGAYLVAQVSNFDRLLCPLYAISYGNQIDLTVSDYLDYLGEDERIDVFGVYVEGFQPLDGLRFLEKAEKAVKAGKVILLYKAGRTREGGKAAASHTASIVGDFEVCRELLDQAGVIVTDTLNMLEDYVMTFAFLAGKRRQGNRVAILSNAGFECTAGADKLHHLKLANLSPETEDRLRGCLPPGLIDPHNPLDTTPIANTESFVAIVEALAEDPGVDCIVVSAVPATPALEMLAESADHGEVVERETSLPKRLVRTLVKYDKPIVLCVDSGALYTPAVKILLEAGLPCFRKIDRATRALSAFVTYGTR